MAGLLQWGILFCVFETLFGSVDSHRQCGHIAPKAHEVVHHVYIEPAHILRKRSLDQPLRVFLHYDASVNLLSKEKLDLINNTVLPQAVQYWEKTLTVRHTASPIRLNRRCETDEVFFKANDPIPYCQKGCERKTVCGEVEVPEDHLELCRVCDSKASNCNILGRSPGRGISNADFVFYISAIQTERCGKGTVVAYAAHCQQEAALDRPIAGHANLCPESISVKKQELETLVSTVKHEMLHALGFSVSLYAFFRDKFGRPLSPRAQNGKPFINSQTKLHEWSSRVIRNVTRNDWKVRGGSMTRVIQMMVTPRVVEEARRHFACPNLEGAELEDQGGEGTLLTHWEKRVFENEAMTGIHTQNPVYSRITLALMEDTGWYRPNYDMSEHLAWGNGLGCNFVQKSCKDWIDTKESRNEPVYPFCKKVKKYPPQTECMTHRRAVALCNLISSPTELPAVYQNFDSLSGIKNNEVGFFGGSVDLADYCPYLQEFTWKLDDVVVRGSQCQYLDNNPKPVQNFALEKYGPQSRCFDHGPKMWIEATCMQSRIYQHWGSGCYEYSCSEGRLHINVLNYTYTCYYSKQLIHIELFSNGWLHKGSIICPPCQEMCADSKMKCLSDENQLDSLSNYHRDFLQCVGTMWTSSPVLIFFLILFLSLS